MAIQVYCTKCRSSYELDTKECKKCGTKFSKSTRKYRVTVSVKGKRETRILDNLTSAREVEPTLKADILRGEFDIDKPKKCITLGDMWDKYLPWAKQNKKSWIDDERYYKKHIKDRFAKKEMDKISPMDIERLKNGLKKGKNKRGKPFAPATIKHVLVIIRRLYNLSRKWGLYDGKNPIESVQLPKIDNQVTEFLSDEQYKKLMDTLDKWPFRESALLVKFALFTGFRRGEIFKLTWDAVDFERGLISLKDPKGGRSEVLPISNEALDVLREVEETDSPYVFPGKDGAKRTDFKGAWGRIRNKAGLPKNFRFHGLRHHFASTLVSNGIDLVVVKELLTHKDMTTTQRYAHLAPDAMKKAALKSGELLKPKVKAKSEEKTDNVVQIAE